MTKTILSCLFLVGFATVAAAGQTPSPSGAAIYIISPSHGETVSSPVKVVFGMSGMGVAPAGTQKENTGHHHLIIDSDLPAADKPVPADDKHIHFGGGQTETVIELPAGTHTLQLLLGDWSHIPHNPPVASKQITITVE